MVILYGIGKSRRPGNNYNKTMLHLLKPCDITESNILKDNNSIVKFAATKSSDNRLSDRKNQITKNDVEVTNVIKTEVTCLTKVLSKMHKILSKIAPRFYTDVTSDTYLLTLSTICGVHSRPISFSRLGVDGITTSCFGVDGTTARGFGVVGTTLTAFGVVGTTLAGMGVNGATFTLTAFGVVGTTFAGLGVGTTFAGFGVNGTILTLAALGVVGTNFTGFGVDDTTFTGFGVVGTTLGVVGQYITSLAGFSVGGASQIGLVSSHLSFSICVRSSCTLSSYMEMQHEHISEYTLKEHETQQ